MVINTFDGATWSIKAAKKLLPILIQCAKKKKTIYYSEAKFLLAEAGISPALDVKYGHPAGIVGDALNELAEKKREGLYPPLNALVIAKANNLPGSGVDWYLAKYLGISKQSVAGRRRAIYVAKVQQDVFSYRHWDAVAKTLGTSSVKLSNIDELDNADLPSPPKPSREGKGGEGPEHRRLKEYVAENPQAVGLKIYKQGQTERRFFCSDRADVYFYHQRNPVAVECKTALASNDELTSGIFQCVKYEALLKAEMIYSGVQGSPKCILATGRVLPSSHQRLAKLLGVDWYFVSYDA